MNPAAGNVARFLAAGALFWALYPHDYSYYLFLRWLVCAIGLLTAFQFYRADMLGHAFGFLGLAFVFNPVIPVYLSRSTWSVIDIAAALAFLWTAGTLSSVSDKGA